MASIAASAASVKRSPAQFKDVIITQTCIQFHLKMLQQIQDTFRNQNCQFDLYDIISSLCFCFGIITLTYLCWTDEVQGKAKALKHTQLKCNKLHSFFLKHHFVSWSLLLHSFLCQALRLIDSCEYQTKWISSDGIWWKHCIQKSWCGDSI